MGPGHLHLAGRGRDDPVDRRAHRLRRPALAGPVGARRHRRADRRAVRARPASPSSSPSPPGSCSPSPSAASSPCPALRTRGVNLAVVTLGLGFTVSEVVFANNQYVGGGLEGGTPIGRVKLFGIAVDAFGHPHRWALVSLVAFVGDRPRRGQPPAVADRAPAHRGAHQRAGRGVARHQRRGREALRLRGGGRHRRGGRHPHRLPVPAHPVRHVQRVRVDQRGRLRRDRRPRLRARGRVRRPQRRGRPRHQAARGPRRPGRLGRGRRRGPGDRHPVAHQNGIADVVDARGPAARPTGCGSPPGRARSTLPEAAAEAVPPATLAVEGLTVRFGSVVAVHDVSFEVRPGEVVGLIGPNGAGKTTVIDAVTGFVRPAARHRSRSTAARSTGSAPPGGRTSACAGRSSRSSCSTTSTSRATSAPGPSRAPRRRRGWATCCGRAGTPSAPRRSPPSGASTCRRPRRPARGAVLREAPPGGHRAGGGVGTVGRPARRAGRRPRRDREPRAGRPHPAAGARAAHGHPPGRARRPARDVDLRPHRVHRLRPGHRLGHSRRGAGRRRGSWPPTWAPTRQTRAVVGERRTSQRRWPSDRDSAMATGGEPGLGRRRRSA